VSGDGHTNALVNQVSRRRSARGGRLDSLSKDTSAHGRRERAPRDWNLLRDHVNVQRSGKTPGQQGVSGFRADNRQVGHGGSRYLSSYCSASSPRPRSKECHLRNAPLRAAPYHRSSPLGARNAWPAQEREDYAAISTALSLCVRTAGLFGEDCNNAATTGTEKSSRTWRHNPSQSETSPGLQVLLNTSWQAKLPAHRYEPPALVTDGATPALRPYWLVS
jgi:hypothetical protein